MGEMGFATPVRSTEVTADSKIPASGDQSKWYGGCIVTSGAAATTVLIRDGTDATGAVKFTYKVEVANATRQFVLWPLLVKFDIGVFVDADANTAAVDVIHG